MMLLWGSLVRLMRLIHRIACSKGLEHMIVKEVLYLQHLIQQASIDRHICQYGRITIKRVLVADIQIQNSLYSSQPITSPPWSSGYSALGRRFLHHRSRLRRIPCALDSESRMELAGHHQGSTQVGEVIDQHVSMKKPLEPLREAQSNRDNVRYVTSAAERTRD